MNSVQDQDEPNTLDQLRRARGEGWQWAKAATEPCPQCGLDPGGQPAETLCPQLLSLAAGWRTFLLEADDTYLRTNPAPGIFSPLQYGAHVRDIQGKYADRIVLALAQDNPTVPQFNPADDEWESFNQLSAEELADGLQAQAQRLTTLFSDLRPEQRLRTVVRDGGHDGVFSFTLTGLVSYAVHESHHHLLDANGTLTPRT